MNLTRNEQIEAEKIKLRSLPFSIRWKIYKIRFFAVDDNYMNILSTAIIEGSKGEITMNITVICKECKAKLECAHKDLYLYNLECPKCGWILHRRHERHKMIRVAPVAPEVPVMSEKYDRYERQPRYDKCCDCLNYGSWKCYDCVWRI